VEGSCKRDDKTSISIKCGVFSAEKLLVSAGLCLMKIANYSVI
jgi:hypothetical protein